MRRKRKQKTTKDHKFQPRKTTTVKEQPVDVEKSNKIKRFFKSATGIITTLTTVATLGTLWFVYREEIHKAFSSKHDLYEDEHVTSGTIVSPRISDHAVEDTRPSSMDEIRPQFYFNPSTYIYPIIKGIYIKGLSKMTHLNFALGSSNIGAIKVPELYKGIDYGRIISVRGCDMGVIRLAAKQDRLYASAVFYDLEDELEIGEMEYNHWKVYDGRYLDYRCDEQNFELIDNRGRVVFRICYSDKKDHSFVSIDGYFVSPQSVLIINTMDNRFGCIEKTGRWKERVNQEAHKIKRLLESKCE